MRDTEIIVDKAVRSSELSKRINQAWLGFCTSESHGHTTKETIHLTFGI